MATVQFAILPSFTTLVLPDTSSLDDAISYILTHLRTSASHSNDIVHTYSNTITSHTGCMNIGELRTLTDAEFRTLPLPAMLRIYLKYLIRGTQSGRTGKIGTITSSNTSSSPSLTSPSPAVDPFLIHLQNDFNYGESFDLTQYKSNLDSLSLMGFSFHESMEALCVTENKSVQAACEYLISHCDEQSRREKRARVVERLGKQASLHKRTSAVNTSTSMNTSLTTTSSTNNITTSSSLMHQLIEQELSLVRCQLIRERGLRIQMVREYQHLVDEVLPIKFYNESMKLLLTKEYLLPHELDLLNSYRARHHIDSTKHIAALNEIGIESITSLDSLIRKVDKNKAGTGSGSNGASQQPGDMDCVVCLDKPKTYIIMNCMHLCLCEDCATQWMQNKGAANSFNKNCPICSKKITQIARIYV